MNEKSTELAKIPDAVPCSQYRTMIEDGLVTTVDTETGVIIERTIRTDLVRKAIENLLGKPIESIDTVDDCATALEYVKYKESSATDRRASAKATYEHELRVADGREMGAVYAFDLIRDIVSPIIKAKLENEDRVQLQLPGVKVTMPTAKESFKVNLYDGTDETSPLYVYAYTYAPELFKFNVTVKSTWATLLDDDVKVKIIAAAKDADISKPALADVVFDIIKARSDHEVVMTVDESKFLARLRAFNINPDADTPPLWAIIDANGERVESFVTYTPEQKYSKLGIVNCPVFANKDGAKILNEAMKYVVDPANTAADVVDDKKEVA